MESASIDIPSTAPVMILPECNLLPHAMLPLFVFEPRYREMLEDALSEDRLFCIGVQKGNSNDDRESDEKVYPHSTIGLIRASVAHEDGTSHLVLQGLQRVEFLEWIEGHPYSQARIAPVKTIVSNQIEGQALAARLLESAQKLIESGMEVSEQLQSDLSSAADPDATADIIAYNFIADPYIRQKILETPEVSERLQIVIDGLLAR